MILSHTKRSTWSCFRFYFEMEKNHCACWTLHLCEIYQPCCKLSKLVSRSRTRFYFSQRRRSESYMQYQFYDNGSNKKPYQQTWKCSLFTGQQYYVQCHQCPSIIVKRFTFCIVVCISQYECILRCWLQPDYDYLIHTEHFSNDNSTVFCHSNFAHRISWSSK